MPVGCRCVQDARGRRAEGGNGPSSVDLRAVSGSGPDGEVVSLYATQTSNLCVVRFSH